MSDQVNYLEVWEGIPQNERDVMRLPGILKEYTSTHVLMRETGTESYWRAQTIMAGLNKLVDERMYRGAIEASDVLEPLYGFMFTEREARHCGTQPTMAFITRYLNTAELDESGMFQFLEGKVNFGDEGYLFSLIRNLCAAIDRVDASLSETVRKPFAVLDWAAIARGGIGRSDTMVSFEGILRNMENFVAMQDPEPDVLKSYLSSTVTECVQSNIPYWIPATGFFD